jgi:hypothetical protein
MGRSGLNSKIEVVTGNLTFNLLTTYQKKLQPAQQ